MGAEESRQQYAAPPRDRQLVPSRPSSSGGGAQVFRVQTERREVQTGGTRLEAERICVQGVTIGQQGHQVSQIERVRIRLSSSEATVSNALQWRSPMSLLLDSDDDSDDTDKCSYESHGPGHFNQQWYKCRTCWGGESQFGCCEHCAETCHHGHELINDGVMHAECDCGQNRHQQAVCTWHVTRQNYVQQPFYRCYDCFSGGTEGVCYQCVRRCHRGHNTLFAGTMRAFCDCGLTCCRIKCSIPSPR